MTPVEAEPSQQSAAPAGNDGDAGEAPRTPNRLTRWLLPAVALVAAVVVGIVLLAGGGDDEKPAAARRALAVAASLERLAAASAGAGHPVYWAGARDGTTYELSETRDGRIFIRYLPAGVSVGASEARYLTVATYPQARAFQTLLATARAQGVEAVTVPGGGRAFQDRNRAESAYVAFPGSNVQIEIFDATAGEALRLARSGAIVPVRAAVASGEPRAVSPQQLAQTATQAGHPVYWAGAEEQTTYELTEERDGRIYVRYLPSGVAVGDDSPRFLTVGTYPQPDPLASLRRAAADSGSATFEVEGGTAYADAAHPKSVYVAYRDSGVQVEVYDPVDGRARTLLTSGRIVPAR
ncbi:hypothetical protein [Conexibacter woesei]|uniref:Uncharacterized protein n=1 Tax=Conexibacter woesei (strain DSM 14684 / CCUG 47730 / CIP 108061 / JCM 11494 / NBRC 100937 / ID131577) TaxID=469383 RepID=D3F8Z5_CONWI|nr:hypothetical protein [Conexibacter woesei]ADB52990.1 hypothetical protein Cwoe_4577 [Conexibacter woesei DSM 14684]